MAEPKKYLDLEGLKTFWGISKKYIDDVAKGIDESAASISSLKFEENAVIEDNGISIKLNKSNISGTQSDASTSVTIPLKGEETPGIITELVKGDGTSVEIPKNGSVKVNVSVDNSSIKISETGSLTVDIIDGGIF